MKNVVYEGQVFGLLTVTDATPILKNSATHCKCQCVCGALKIHSISNLLLGKSKSCGCWAKKVTSLVATTHGKSKGPEYRTWRNMLNRCTNPNVGKYELYGGRGIKVCEKWKKFEAFYADMGDKPSPKHSIGRIDNNGNYEPSNCRWESIDEQANNKSTNVFIEFDGETKTYSQWAKTTGIPYWTIVQRHRAGMSPETIFNDCDDGLKKKYIVLNGQRMTTTQWMKEAGIPISSFYHHIRKGLTPEQVVEHYLLKKGQ
jgi:uncharacterized protein (DUF433 family)